MLYACCACNGNDDDAFVNEERINAGVLKALGYETKDVMKKFAVYGFTAGVSGTILGSYRGRMHCQVL